MPFTLYTLASVIRPHMETIDPRWLSSVPVDVLQMPPSPFFDWVRALEEASLVPDVFDVLDELSLLNRCPCMVMGRLLSNLWNITIGDSDRGRFSHLKLKVSDREKYTAEERALIKTLVENISVDSIDGIRNIFRLSVYEECGLFEDNITLSDDTLISLARHMKDIKLFVVARGEGTARYITAGNADNGYYIAYYQARTPHCLSTFVHNNRIEPCDVWELFATYAFLCIEQPEGTTDLRELRLINPYLRECHVFKIADIPPAVMTIAKISCRIGRKDSVVLS